MAIYRLFQKHPFEPEDITRLAKAYERALVELKLADRNDPITELIAKKIFEAAQTGIRDQDQLCEMAIAEYRHQ